MSERFNFWIQGIIVAVSITTIVEMLLPNSNNKKYVKVVCSIYILFTIVSPILNITKYDFNILERKYNSNIEVYTSEYKEVSSIYIEAYEEEIKQNLICNGFNIRDIRVNLDENLENIINIEIDTYYISEEEKTTLENNIRSKYEIENIIIR